MRLATCQRRVRRGAVLAQMALCVTVLVGILAVCLDGGVLLAERQHAQSTADAAALAAAADLFKNWNTYGGLDTPGTATKSANTIATANGYTSSNSTITVNIPPTAGDHIGVNGYAEVIVNYNQGRYFSQLWSKNTITVSARAVARGMLITGSASPNDNVGILVLSTSGSGAVVTEKGANANIKIVNSRMFAVNDPNSGSNYPFDSNVNQDRITAGGFTFAVPDANHLGQPPQFVGPSPTFSTTTSDPLSSFTAPSTTGLPSQSYSGGTTMNPGVYTGTVNIGNNNVVMNPGIYYLNPDASGNAGISVGGNGTLDGTSGVFIYVAPGTGTVSMFGTPNGNGTSAVNINPIGTGTYRGISIWVDKGWPAGSQTIVMGGTPNASIFGTVYAPTSNLELHGSVGGTVGTQLIAYTIDVRGSNTLTVGGGPQAGQSIGFQLTE
jgi:Flp pilus assembly protein TadG